VEDKVTEYVEEEHTPSDFKSGEDYYNHTSVNTCAENLTPGEARCGIFSELGGCALLSSLP
jgi:hypothetical protein